MSTSNAFQAVATDYDGTIAHHGRVGESTLDALRAARRAGLRLILVTGRSLDDLAVVFPHSPLFDRIVGENGAILSDPLNGVTRPIASPPPPALLESLASKGVPYSVGRSIVSTVVPHDAILRESIRELALDWDIVFNKEAAMALPSAVTKASGLERALLELGVPPVQTVAIGDAENDLAAMALCGFSVAVNNAVPAVKRAAHLVTARAEGDGVAEFLALLLSGELADRDSGARSR